MTISRGRAAHTIDIRHEITGCIGKVVDGSTGDIVAKKAWEAKVVCVDDVDTASAKYAVLVLIASAPNCTMQGDCGAAEDNLSLLLLYEDRRFHPVSHMRVDIQDCKAGADVIAAEGPPKSSDDINFPNWFRRIVLRDDKLWLQFIRYKPGHNLDDEALETCMCTYVRNNAQKGIMIVTKP